MQEITREQVRSGVIDLLQQLGYTTEATYELVDEAIDSVREDPDEEGDESALPENTWEVRSRTTAIEKTWWRITLPGALETYRSDVEFLDSQGLDAKSVDDVAILQAAAEGAIPGATITVTGMENDDDPVADWDEWDSARRLQ